MSYIRTKNGIVAFGEKYAYPTRLSNGKTYFSFKELTDDRFDVMKEYNHWEILNQSENLEELCDEFVCEWFAKKVNRYRHIYCRFKIGQGKELYRRDTPLPADVNFEIYAGIWINGKGLIYVAKMNDKGELELI